MGLILVPTPIGNLQDITLRALEVLRTCDVVAAEDTRVARRLLSAHGIAGKHVVGYREQNASRAEAALLRSAAEGVVALTTDAGMPGVSDPGRALINAAREAGIAVDVLPGPVAFVTGAVLSGFAVEGLLFGGFLPRGTGKRKRALSAALARDGATAYYESPHRMVKTLEAIEQLAPEAPIFVVRELTKRFEQQIAGTAREALDALEVPLRGEFVLIVQGGGQEAVDDDR